MYPEEESSAISSPTATRPTSLDPNDSPSSPASADPHGCCWSCFPCLDGARERGIQFSMKLREKSELIAGPKWKTFIRRFNQGHHNRRQGEGRFLYDPLSYALNFEDQNGGEEDEDAVAGFRNFSSRFAPAAGSGKPAGDVAVYG